MSTSLFSVSYGLSKYWRNIRTSFGYQKLFVFAALLKTLTGTASGRF